MSLVTVLIVNYNAGPWLERCIAALDRQTFRDFSIVIVDNASTDNSLASVKRDHPKIQLLRSERNLGFAGGNNFGLARSPHSEWTALLNPDAFPRPDWLERLLAAAEANPAFVAFGSRTLANDDGTVLDGVGDAYHVCGNYWQEGHGLRAAGRYLRSTEIFSPCAAAALYRTDVLLSVGGFDEDYFCYVEDVDLGFRLRLAGHRCMYVSDAIVQHIGSAIVGSYSDFQLYYGHRNLVWNFVKNMPGWMLWAYLPYHVALNVYSTVRFALNGRGKVLAHAKIDAIRGLGKVLAKRRRVQQARAVRPAELLRVMRRGRPRPTYRDEPIEPARPLATAGRSPVADRGRVDTDEVIGSGTPL
jgi:GT2 family glycosyltransferase